MTEEKTPLRRLAEFIHELSWEQLPEPVKEAAKLRVLDLVSTAAGAADSELVRKIGDSLSSIDGQGACHVWGWERTYPAPAAAMLNAMLAHTLELDDVHTASKTHGSASLIPAAWSCAEQLGKSGREFLEAAVCGYETVSRVGMAFGVSAHRSRGWHATSTCGVFGCAAACAKLLELDVDQIVSALGMAGTQSCGVWAFLGDGSSCKILHTGRAASNGMEAAFFALAGMTGPEHILEAEDGGLLRAMSDGGDVNQLCAGLGERYELLSMDMKPYPCCRSAHCAIDCALTLRDQVPVEEIASIEIGTYLVGYQQCAVSEGCRHPKNALEAKFSTPYATAAALLYGRVSAAEFEPALVESGRVQQLADKVTVRPEERFTARYPGHWGCSMKIIRKDGSVYETEVQDPSGSAARPLDRKQAMDKARTLLSAACGGREEEQMERLLTLEQEKRLPVLSPGR